MRLILGALFVLLLSGSGAQYYWSKDSVSQNTADDFGTKLRFEYYLVEGSTYEEVRGSLLANGPVDPLGKRRFAYTDWKITWHWPTPNDVHQIEKVTSDYTVVVHMPRWNPPVGTDQKLIDRWNSMYQQMQKHELQHASHARLHYQEVAEAVRSAVRRSPSISPKAAHDIAFAELRKIRKLDSALDYESDYGRRDGVVF